MQPLFEHTDPAIHQTVIFLLQNLAGLPLSVSLLPHCLCFCPPPSLWWEATGTKTVRIDRRRHGEDGRAVMWAYYSCSSSTDSAVSPPPPWPYILLSLHLPLMLFIHLSPLSSSRYSLHLALSIHPCMPHGAGELYWAIVILLLCTSTCCICCDGCSHSQ